MWEKIQHSPLYFINFTNEENDYKIYMTDFISLWSRRFTRNGFLQMLEESNEGFEYNNEETFLEYGIKLIRSKPEQLQRVSIEKKENGNIVEIQLIRDNLKLKCQFMKGTAELFCEKITNPLLNVIKNFITTENELKRKLKSKDDELNAYKIKKGKLGLRSIETDKFTEELYKKNSLYDAIFGQSEVPQISIDAVEDEVDVKQETQNFQSIKTEENITMKIEPDTDRNMPACTNTYDISGRINVEIKQEIKDCSSICSETVKKRAKILKLI